MASCVYFVSLLIAAFLPSLSKGFSTLNPTTIIPHHTTDRDNVKMCEDGYCDDDDYDFWWFWLFMVIAVLFASLCCGFCCRLRLQQRRRRVLILAGERPDNYSCYGTTEVVSPVIFNAPQHPGYNTYNPYGYPQPQLPSYTPAAENKGKPPPYT